MERNNNVGLALVAVNDGQVVLNERYGVKNIETQEQLLEQLLEQQGASLNVLTASPHITLDACAKRVGLWELFDNIWSCDDFGTTKADPEIYKMAAERIGLPVEDIIFLDDNLGADKTAKSAGMNWDKKFLYSTKYS